QKYRCRCGECITTAPGPAKLVPGGRYSVDFAVAVAVAKYLDHLPLARQVRQMARVGLVVDTQTLWDQLLALGHHLTPTYDALVAEVLTAPVLGADETTWQLMEPGRSKTWWVWALCRPDAVVYRLLGTRSAAGAATVLGDYRGIVLCDGYAAYRALAKRGTEERAGPTITLAHCWAHVRRQYVEAEPSYPQTAEILARIGEARGGRAGRVSRRGHPSGDRDTGHRHAPARSRQRVGSRTFNAGACRDWPRTIDGARRARTLYLHRESSFVAGRRGRRSVGR